jgi:uncharacterized protein YdeI (YjbR/CyaY-like superfamily)
MAIPKELPILPFASALLLEQWLFKHHAQFDGVWIKMAKKASGVASVTHDEALEVALCYGWIDGQRNSYDDSYFLQKFTPRRPNSLWSKRNIAKVERLIIEGRMQPSGLAEVKAAKRDGRWEAAYASQRTMVVPEDFLKALKENKPAQAFFNTLSKAKVYALTWRLETAKKPETRQRRFDASLAMLARGEFH